jgi:hypothetical protein
LGLLLFWLWCIETPLTLFQEEVKVSCWNTIEATHVPLGLVPEVLDTVDVVCLIREELRVVDAEVLEAGHIEHVVGTQRVRVDDRVRHNLLVDDGLQGDSFDVGYDLGIDLAAAFSQAKYRNLACGTASTLALAMPAEVALVNLDLAEQGGYIFTLLGDDLAQTVEVQHCRALVHADQRSRRPRRRPGHKMLY